LEEACEIVGAAWTWRDEKGRPAITAIKQVRSAPVQEPHSWYSAEHDEWMTNKTRKEHEALNSYTHKVDGFDLALYPLPPAAQPAPVQEPVAWIEHHKGGDNLEWENPGGKCTPLYTTPPAAQRQWVGLTEKDLEDCAKGCRSTEEFAAEIEAKLKEKNA